MGTCPPYIAHDIKIISYQEKQDFSAIDNTYVLDKEAYRQLKLSISTDTIKMLKKAKPEAADNLDKFSQNMSNFGSSMLSRRRNLNLASNADTEAA